ncbi:FAD/FMN-containing isoamyl alcohol oxidase-like protein MreA [Karstenula rhodostoma CBS 690.94]|uniref:FAD/FMN-containing isoamyl alcohol oxidase-like protein MreA n=1 Tax=Karstenula rhodostoma CBS 690.94 TaxID=1392251 RepID=A0A9P4PIY1_9PLEO|nr:FAD/FMN-containing isoamyl alcohol oxidase-like protein MreA [Karstenula rhodostoma CBS 690.94]
MVSLRACLSFFVTFRVIVAYKFPYESVQLTDADVANNSDITFGRFPGVIKAQCKAFPGDSNWPTTDRWDVFNSSLGGSLFKAIPPAAACYSGIYENASKCAAWRQQSRSSLSVSEDPLIPFNQWTLGNPCPVPGATPPGSNVTSPPLSACHIEYFPAYVVNVSTVKHIQLAINFARNNNIRLTIKNTGHDWLGRNTGGGALQVYVHHLKDFEYLPSVQIGRYEGKAARVGVALEQYELFPHMEENNITLLAPGSSTVGAYGGYMQGGGFSYITSKFGLMADQVLALEVVTADGRFVHADPKENEDLFFAIRGGGPSNYGIVTSAIVKAYDSISVARMNFNFQTGVNFEQSNITTWVDNSTVYAEATKEPFWNGVDAYFAHLVRINDAKGIGWNTLSTQAPNPIFNRTERLFSFTGQVIIPGISAGDFSNFVAPITQDLRDVGIDIKAAVGWWPTYPSYSFRPNGPGEAVGNGRFVSRLFPRSIFEDANSPEFVKAMAAIRTWVEEGHYNFHSVDYHPSYATAGYPGQDSAVNPHLRTAIMHATGFDTGSYGPERTPEEMIVSHARLNAYAQKWRDATPGSGAYMNEADTEEPDFQESFYGNNYNRLLGIKKERDPWGVFYAVTGVGSDEWRVEGIDGLPTQQGRLCRRSE